MALLYLSVVSLSFSYYYFEIQGVTMINNKLKGILKEVTNLNYPDLKKLRHEVENNISNNQVGKAIAEHEDRVCSCPHCDSELITKWGVTKQGIQRFRCKACFKTFNALFSTPFYRMKKSEKWVNYSNLMWNGTSLRESASLLNINLKTAFRWRHVFLKQPHDMIPSDLHGIIEADETFIAESFKGKRKISRPARKRGGGNPLQVPIIMVLDRAGNMVHKVIENNTRENIEAVLTPVISAGSVLCTDGNISYIGIAKNLNVDHKRLINLDNQRVIEGVYHIQTLNNYMMRWKSWLKRFCGVGTDYLENYLSWFRFMTQNKEHSDQAWVEYAL